MLSVSYAGKFSYSAGKTNGVLGGGAYRANGCFVMNICILNEGLRIYLRCKLISISSGSLQKFSKKVQ